MGRRAGRMAEPASYELTESIAAQGITYGRMKTGTPVRIDGRSVHYEDMEVQPGEADWMHFDEASQARFALALEAKIRVLLSGRS